MDSDIEELAARKKREKERNVLDSLPKGQRVPGRYTPEFVAMLVWRILVTAHLLMWFVAGLVGGIQDFGGV